MFTYLKKSSWSPFVVGSAIGLLAATSLIYCKQQMGASSPFVHIAGFFTDLWYSSYVQNSVYYQAQYVQKPIIDWQFALVVAIFFGAWISAHLGKSLTSEWVPGLWAHRFGASKIKRAVGALIGGMFIIFGARLAGGCTSGKAISSGLQLGLSAWLFIIGLFSSGVITAFILYRTRISK